MIIFNSIKKQIAFTFKNREGFTDEIIDAITATYVYFSKNFTESVKNEEIPDFNTFKIGSLENKVDFKNTSLADIYLNRIYNNVKRVTKDTTATGEYFPNKHEIAFKDDDYANRLSKWSFLNLNEQDKQIFKSKLRAKIIVHELIHAGSDNGITTGFLLNDNNALHHDKLISKYYNDSRQCSGEASRLEESITEILALNIVENNNLAKCSLSNSNGNYTIVSRNLDSSNAALNPIAEVFARTFKDVVKGKFTDGFKWLADFSDNYKYFLDSKTNFVYKFNNSLKDVANYCGDNDETIRQKVWELTKEFQKGCLDYYVDNNLIIQNKEQAIELLNDYTAFNTYLVNKDGKIAPELQNSLNSILNQCKIESQKYNLDSRSIVCNEFIRLHSKTNDGKVVYNKPYSSLKDDQTELEL